MIRTIALLVLLCSAATAQNLPARYSVDGVAADDVLNVRIAPDAASDKIDELGPHTQNVEVLRTLEGWGQIPTPEGFGWVSMRFLVPNPWPENEIPRPLVCSGTEPFWTFAMYPRGTEYSELGQGDGTPTPVTILLQATAPNGFLVTTQDGPSLFRTLSVSSRDCSDGMSDRPFGMSATLFTQSLDGNYMQTGCCTIQPN